MSELPMYNLFWACQLCRKMRKTGPEQTLVQCRQDSACGANGIPAPPLRSGPCDRHTNTHRRLRPCCSARHRTTARTGPTTGRLRPPSRPCRPSRPQPLGCLLPACQQHVCCPAAQGQAHEWYARLLSRCNASVAM